MNFGSTHSLCDLHEMLVLDYGMTTVAIAYTVITEMEDTMERPSNIVQIIARLADKSYNDVAKRLAEAHTYFHLPKIDQLKEFNRFVEELEAAHDDNMEARDDE